MSAIGGYLSITNLTQNGYSFDDTILIDRASKGDGDAFGVLYVRYLDPIYRYVYFRVGDSADAEDITEQVFLKAWEALPNYQQRGFALKSWLYRIANNMVIDHHRKRKAQSLSEFPEEGVPHATYAPLADQMIQAETISSLADAIGRLPDEQQQVIILRFIEGLRHSEVADVMGKSEGACRALQYRALAVLSQQLVAK